MVYRSLHGLAPDYLSYRFEKRETIYCPRDSDNKLKVPLPRTNYYQRSLGIAAQLIPFRNSRCHLEQSLPFGTVVAIWNICMLFFPFFYLVSSLKLILVWIRIRVSVSISCISAIKSLPSS